MSPITQNTPYAGWTINTGFLTGNLFSGWSSDELDGYDTDASARSYAALCHTALCTAYPGALVEVSHQDGEGSLPFPLKTCISGPDDLAGPDDYAAEDVERICSRVFEQAEWLVHSAR